MSYSRKALNASFLVFLMTAFPLFFFPSQVFHHLGPKGTLNERWDWAIQEAKKQGLKDGF